jgi:hypothetical protein
MARSQICCIGDSDYWLDGASEAAALETMRAFMATLAPIELTFISDSVVRYKGALAHPTPPEPQLATPLNKARQRAFSHVLGRVPRTTYEWHEVPVNARGTAIDGYQGARLRAATWTWTQGVLSPRDEQPARRTLLRDPLEDMVRCIEAARTDDALADFIFAYGPTWEKGSAGLIGVGRTLLRPAATARTSSTSLAAPRTP